MAFNDLAEHIVTKIVEFLPLDDLDTSVFGKCCKSSFSGQKSVPDSKNYLNYLKMAIMGPNLKYIRIENPCDEHCMNLYIKCPRIESFTGPLSGLVQYVRGLRVADLGRSMAREAI